MPIDKCPIPNIGDLYSKIPKTVAYLDDILISEQIMSKHNSNPRAMLEITRCRVLP